MEYFNGILCIEAKWLIEERIFGYDNYKKMNIRNKLDVVRRACLNTPALVAYDSIPEQFKTQIRQKLGGDPYEMGKQSELLKNIVADEAARLFFRDEYRLENGETLPEPVQTEYTANAEILNAIHRIASERKPKAKSIGKATGLWPKMADAVSNLDKTVFKHSLPANYRRLQEKYRNYMGGGYESLIHGNWCNKNSEKINDEAKVWMLSRWASMKDRIATENQLLNEYNQLAESQEWKQLKSVDAIHNFLYQPEIKPLWWGHRYGEQKFKEKFAYQQKTILPSMRDSLWYSDGTKLNYFYQYLKVDKKTGKTTFAMGTTSVYEVMDAYSECLVGYHISDTEDYVAQYNAYRMALQFSGSKPYQVTYDNQGGHKKLENGDFLSKLAHLSIRTKPYNGKSKTIESAFGRFQQQILKRDWYFTGQNIQAKKDESKANLEFINANKHNLPTRQEIADKYKQRRDEWNNAPHPKTGKARIEMYRESQNPKAVKLELMDMVDLFWVLREKPVTCDAYGISFKEKGVGYDYMVMLSNGLPDVRWLAKNIDRKFRIKFDPQDLSMIYLYEDTPQGLRFITSADQKVSVHRGKQEQEDREASWLKKVDAEINDMRVETLNEIRSFQEKHNQLPEQHGLITPAIKGVNRQKTEGRSGKPEGKKQKQASDNFGRLQKAISNAVAAGMEDEDFSDDDLYKMM